MYAASNGLTVAVRLLSEAGADKDLRADLRQEGGETPLMFACDKGHLEIARLLEAAAALSRFNEYISHDTYIYIYVCTCVSIYIYI